MKLGQAMRNNGFDNYWNESKTIHFLSVSGIHFHHTVVVITAGNPDESVPQGECTPMNLERVSRRAGNTKQFMVAITFGTEETNLSHAETWRNP
jgi:hypothetical protein